MSSAESVSKYSDWGIFKNIISLVCGRVFISLSRLIVSLVIVRLGNPELFGSYVVVISIVYIGEWLMDFGYSDIAVRNISQNFEKRREVLHAYSSIKLIQSVIAYSLVVLAIYALDYRDLLPATVIGGISLIFYGIAQIYRVNFRIDLSMYKDMMSESFSVAVMIVLVVIFCLTSATVTELIACHTISRFFYLAGNIFLNNRNYSPMYTASDIQSMKRLTLQAAPLGIAGILVSCYDSIFPLMISKLMNMEAVAHYSVAIRLIFPIVLVTLVIANVFYTPLSNYWLNNKQNFISTQQNLVEITLYMASGFFCLLYTGAELIVSIFGAEMADSAVILRMLSWAILARAITTTMALPVIICGGQKKTMWLTLFVVTSSAVMVAYLVPMFGVFGAVAAYLIAEILLNAIPVILISQNMAHFRLKWKPIIGIVFPCLPAVLIPSALNLDGTVTGCIAGMLIFICISYLTGAVTNRKILSLVDIIINRSPTKKVSNFSGGLEPRGKQKHPQLQGLVNDKMDQKYRFAIVCPGAGLVQRGFERMCLDLFLLLKDDLDLTLYKGGGTNTVREKRLIFITRNGWFVKLFPLHKLIGISNYQLECLLFCISFLLSSRKAGYDVIHCVDPPLARLLYRLRALFNLDFRLLYTEATAMPPGHYPPADHMQQISRISYDDAIRHGIPKHYMTLIPLGFYPERFAVSANRSELRKKYDISEDTFVVLSLAAINRVHKRIDYLIDEIRRIEGDLLLWIDGSMDHGDPDLVKYARNTLGDRCRITQLPTNCVGELFAVADLMVHTALFEAFGLAIVEGASCGVPLLTHNAPHFKWLLDNEAGAIDMSEPGNLSARIKSLMSDPALLETLVNRNLLDRKYAWKTLKDDYLSLYQRVVCMPGSELRVAHLYGLK